MSYRITGLHHVSTTSAHLQANVDFYTGVLGLKLVKQTVNFDDPTHLHLYYGDETGSPGSLVTFFIYPGMKQGTVGWPQVAGLHFDVSSGMVTATLRPRLERLNIDATPSREDVADTEFGADGEWPVNYEQRPDNWLSISDPDGLPVTVTERRPDAALRRGQMPISNLWIGKATRTATFFEHVLGLPHEYNVVHLPSGQDIAVLDGGGDGFDRGRPGAGTVHHIAFRVSTDAELEALHAHLTEAGVTVSPIRDRVYFKSIYFREPGGILLEVATDGPGFAIDEDPATLGQKLCLPPWLESRRPEIESALPPFKNPNLPG